MEKEKLEKRLLKYTGMASALLGAQALPGQVIWTDIEDTTLSNNGDFYDFNIDQDTAGVIDFRIVQLVDSSSFDFTGVLIRSGNSVFNQVVGKTQANYNYAARLYLGDTIMPTDTFQGINPGRNIGYLAFAIDTPYPNSQWADTINGVTDGFLGLRFTAPTSDSTNGTFYGWIRLDVAADLRSVTIKDFAYQSIPDSSIFMGQGSPIGVEEFEVEKPSMVQRGRFLDISLPETYRPEAQLSFYNLGGQLLRKESFQARQNRVTLENLPKGILIALVRSNGVEASRKIVVY